jgi:general secretion pathway protein L
MLNLNSTIDLDVKTFLRWWGRELSFLVPEKIKPLFSQQQGFIIVRATGQQLVLSYQLNGQAVSLATLDSDDETAATRYKELLASDERLSKAKVILRLTGSAAIQRELALPAAAKENFQQVVAYELDRYTPFKADQVYFAVKALSKPAKTAEQFRVLLVLTTRKTLNDLYAAVKAIGIEPLCADYEGAVNDFDYGDYAYNLLPEGLRPKIAKLPQIIHSSLVSLTLSLLLAVMVMPVWFEYQAVNELSHKVKKLEKEANKIKDLQAEANAIIKETQQLFDEKTKTPSVLVMLDALSNLIKDDTSLAFLQYANGQLQIQGESPAASALIAVLEDSELFNNAVFVSPVTQDTLTKREHFQITAEPSKQANKTDENSE